MLGARFVRSKERWRRVHRRKKPTSRRKGTCPSKGGRKPVVLIPWPSMRHVQDGVGGKRTKADRDPRGGGAGRMGEERVPQAVQTEGRVVWICPCVMQGESNCSGPTWGAFPVLEKPFKLEAQRLNSGEGASVRMPQVQSRRRAGGAVPPRRPGPLQLGPGHGLGTVPTCVPLPSSTVDATLQRMKNARRGSVGAPIVRSPCVGTARVRGRRLQASALIGSGLLLCPPARDCGDLSAPGGGAWGSRAVGQPPVKRHVGLSGPYRVEACSKSSRDLRRRDEAARHRMQPLDGAFSWRECSSRNPGEQ